MSLIHGHTDILGVVGNPIAHSLSPLLHNYWLQERGIPAVYVPFHVKSGINVFLNGLRETNVRGLNITLPYKQEVFEYLEDNVTPEAQQAQAVNVIYRDNDGKFWGDNTDGQGFIEDLQSLTSLHGKKIAILGAGGAARGVVTPLLKAGAKILIFNRNIDNALRIKDMSPDFSGNIEVYSWDYISKDLMACDGLINTTSLGSLDNIANDIRYRSLNEEAFIYDMNYKPVVSPFLESAFRINQNFKIRNGIGMLVGQARLSFQRWFPIEHSVPSLEKSYQYLISHLS